MAETRSGQFVELDASDLPPCCPNRKTPVWNSHPRVYLQPNAAGEARCPYCGTEYRIDPEVLAHAAAH